ncbi:hypothetical protein [Nonomuraea sp. NPDC049758]|uniref:hypothetical protein n=1 Tax=Nonomuraea sp. NPDC049758 TaxID=3154360 RepID=UPI003429E97E
MGIPTIIAPVGDSIADAASLALERTDQPFRSLRELDGVSIAVESTGRINLNLPDGSTVDDTSIGNVLFRGVPSVAEMNTRDRQYAADEWLAAISLLLRPRSTRLVINPPLPFQPRMRTTPHGRRHQLEFRGNGFLGALDYELGNRRRPKEGDTAIAHCAGRVAEPGDLQSANRGRELLTVFRTSVAEIMYVWLVGGVPVASGLLSETAGQRSAEEAALDLARTASTQAGYIFGVAWILKVEHRTNPFVYWDFDPFPSTDLAHEDQASVIGHALAELLVT